jgi:hypothetical protein
MNALISITSYSHNKKKYLDIMLEAYSKWTKYDVSIALAVNYPYEPSGSNITIVPSTMTGWDYTYNNKTYLAKTYHDYDFTVETDDDILVTEANLAYYCQFQGIDKSLIPGFLVAEGKYLISMKAPVFPYVDEKLVIEGNNWIVPHVKHSACFIADRERYAKYLQTASKGVLEASKGYSVGALARTDIYLNDMKKVVLVDGIKDGSALVQHIPMKYSNSEPAFMRWKFMTPDTITHLMQ